MVGVAKMKEKRVSTTFYLLRHGETLFNVQGKSQGWCDSPLTERGIAQCRLTGEDYARRGLTFDHAFSSTSERCCDTLEIVTEAAYGKPMPYERMKGLKELYFGAFEGKDNFLELHEPGRETFYVKFGGEDFRDSVKRFEGALVDIAERCEDERVLVCTHGGITINFYMKWKDHAKVPATLFSNCLTYVYEYENGIFTCTDIFVADLSSLDEAGKPKQVSSFPPIK